MKRKGLLLTPVCRIPQMDSGCAMAVSQIVWTGDRDILNIDLFYGGDVRARYFADRYQRDYCVNIGGRWKRMKIKNAAREVIGEKVLTGIGIYYYGGDEWQFASDRDKKTASDYLETWSVNSFEENVDWEKAGKRAENKRERIARIMADVPPVPERAEQWLDEEIFPEEYLYVTDDEKTRRYRCTKCGGGSWTRKRFTQYKMTQCPKCGAAVKVEKRKDKKFKYANIILLQVVDKDTWVERQFRAEAWWFSEGEKRIDLRENIRALVRKGMTLGKVYYGELPNADEFEQEWWDKNTRNRRFLPSYLYPYNLGEVLLFAGLQYTGIDILAKEKVKFNVNKIFIHWFGVPWLEYLIKSGLTRMGVEIINERWSCPNGCRENARTLKDFFRIDGNRVSRLKKMNGSLCMLEWLQYEQDTGKKVTDETLVFLSKHRISPDQCTVILEAMGSVNRMANYIKRQKDKASRTLNVWRDYMDMAAAEGLDITDDIVRLPKDLKVRHDELVSIRNARRDEEKLEKDREKYRKLDAGILRRLPEVRRYFWEDEKYMIIPAGNCAELMEEGRKLHHCVGASDIYMKKMAEGKSWILFLRKKTELETPYYTIEISMEDDVILQWYSEFDRQPDISEVRPLLENYKKYLKSRRQRVAVSA